VQRRWIASFLDRLGTRRSDGLKSPGPAPRTVAVEYVPPPISGVESGHQRTLGTFGGVFTPSFLTIIGVIMYLRFGWVVGNAGLVRALIIVVIANSITAITGLSIASIGSNERMETGGAYFIVSRVLGYFAGGSIGIPLYFSQTFSISFYVLGFAEAMSPFISGVSIPAIALMTMVVLAAFGLVGARLMIRVQYIILIAVAVSFVSIGAGFRPDYMNLGPAYLEGIDFWRVFAVFFPAVTGILAGVSMSGDLRDPSRSIPRGTLIAIGAGFLVYIAVPMMLGFSVPRGSLYSSDALRNASRWPFLITIGVIGATLSSAIGSILAAPRTLQALANDGIAPVFLRRGVGPTMEPVLGTVVSMGFAAVVIFAGSLNAVAELLTMFFLTTYGLLNLSAGMEMVVGNPSFRPSLRVPGWVSFVGAGACLSVMILINPIIASAAIAAILLIFVLLRLRSSRMNDERRSGGIWEGFWTGRLFRISKRLESIRSFSGKNWRPIIQLFADNTATHGELMTVAAKLGSRGGALGVFALVDRTERSASSTGAFLAELNDALNTLPSRYAYAHRIETESFLEGILVATQAAAFAGSTYNTVMLGLPGDSRRDGEFAKTLRLLSRYSRNLILYKRGAASPSLAPGPVLVWWGGRELNARLMVILAIIYDRSFQTRRPGVRIATIVGRHDEVAGARERLVDLARELRVNAKVDVVVNESERPVKEILAEESKSASLVVIGMRHITDHQETAYLPTLRETVSGLGPTLLVQCNDERGEYV
jgi:amino acid transporter